MTSIHILIVDGVRDPRSLSKAAALREAQAKSREGHSTKVYRVSSGGKTFFVASYAPNEGPMSLRRMFTL